MVRWIIKELGEIRIQKLQIITKTLIGSFTLLFIFSILFSPLFLNSVNAASTIYYISNEGNDSDTGLSPSNAWKTISKVNSALNSGVLNQGDDIYFNRGDTFSDAILNLQLGGTSINRMIIGAYGSGKRPILDGNGNNNIRFSVSDTDCVTIQDLSLENSSSTSLVGSVNLSDIILSNLYLNNCGHNGIYFDNTINLLIKNCTIKNTNHCGLVFYGSEYNRLANVIVENTFVNGSGPEDAITIHRSDGAPKYDVGSNFLFKNVTTTGFGEQGFDLTSGENIILIDCESFGNDDSSILTGNNVRNVTITNFYSHDELGESDTYGFIINPCEQLIIRNSIIYNARYRQLSLETGTKNASIYNNNIIFGLDSSDGFMIDVKNSDGETNDIVFKNNIIYSLRDTIPTNRFLRYLSPASLSNTNSNWSNNIWWRGDGGSSDQRWWTDDNTYLTYANWLGKNQVFNDVRSDPLIDDPANNSWDLCEDSPAIDTGEWLTKTSGSGTGTTIGLENVNYFCDGYGMIDGDCIFIGDDFNLKVTSVDYINNELTVNRSITWIEGENVSLDSFYGFNVDLGASEYVIGEVSPPIISDVDAQPNPQFSGNEVNITCSISSDLSISSVKVNVASPEGDVVNVSMNPHREVYYYSSEFDVVGNYSYFVYASDSDGNTVVSEVFDFFINENDSIPNISNIETASSYPLDTELSFGWVNFSCLVTDDNLNLVYLNYTNRNGVSTNVSMNKASEQLYYYNTTLDTFGNYTYFVWCNDTQSNCNTSSTLSYSLPANWDVNEDKSVTLLDLALISNRFKETGENGWIREDVDNDGMINMLDLMAVSNHFEL